MSKRDFSSLFEILRMLLNYPDTRFYEYTDYWRVVRVKAVNEKQVVFLNNRDYEWLFRENFFDAIEFFYDKDVVLSVSKLDDLALTRISLYLDVLAKI